MMPLKQPKKKVELLFNYKTVKINQMIEVCIMKGIAYHEVPTEATVRACNFIKKETLAQVFSCDFCEIFKNTFCYRTPQVAASVRKVTIFVIY